jgi:hypothetical protein
MKRSIMCVLAATALLGSSVSCGIATSPGAPPGTGLDIHFEVRENQDLLLDSRLKGQRKRELTLFGVPDPESGQLLRYRIYGDYSPGPTYFGTLRVDQGLKGPDQAFVVQEELGAWELAPELQGIWDLQTRTTEGKTLTFRVSLRKDLASLSPSRLRSR